MLIGQDDNRIAFNFNFTVVNESEILWVKEGIGLVEKRSKSRRWEKKVTEPVNMSRSEIVKELNSIEVIKWEFEKMWMNLYVLDYDGKS